MRMHVRNIIRQTDDDARLAHGGIHLRSLCWSLVCAS